MRSITRSQLNCRKKDKAEATSYFGNQAANYETNVQSGLLKVFRTSERNAVLSLLELSPACKRMLDVGIGSGYYSRLAKDMGIEVHGLDISPAMIEINKSYLDYGEVTDIEHFKVKAPYDRVVCAGVLDFSSNPIKALSRLARAVAIGGKLVILCPRVSIGGYYYILEKKAVGINVNLFALEFLKKWAGRNGLKYIMHRHPLPTNMAIQFEKVM